MKTMSRMITQPIVLPTAPADSVYNEVMPKNQPFTKLQEITNFPQTIHVDDFDLQITHNEGDGIERSNAQVDVIFTQTDPSGKKKAVTSLQMSMKQLKSFTILAQQKSNDFFN